MLSNFAGGIDREDAERLEDAGIPVLGGTLSGLAAVGHLFAYRDHRALPPLTGSSPVDTNTRERWKTLLSNEPSFSEAAALGLLSDYGVPPVRAQIAGSLDDVLAAAARIGYPVALKTAMPGIDHKSEVGGVILGLTDPAEATDAYRDLADRLGPQVAVAVMAAPGVEIHLGIVRDEQFGPLVLVAAGGVLVEVLNDRALACRRSTQRVPRA